jgi:hypothetical protein
MPRREFIAGLGSAVTWPSLALVAATSGALVVGITHWRHEAPVEARPVSIAPAISPSSLGAQDQGFATAKAGQNNLAAVLAISPSSPDTGDEPVFDVARIEVSGDAVIAGRAAPGASVELLRSGMLHDRVVADQSGQFVMVPPRLPPGDYELTLRSRQPDGTPATSKQSVVVALQPSFKERPVVALMTRDKEIIVLSNSPGFADARSGGGGRFRGGDRGFHGRFRGLRGGVAAGGFRGTYRGYRGYDYGRYPYYGYGYACWVQGLYWRPIYVCY